MNRPKRHPISNDCREQRSSGKSKTPERKCAVSEKESLADAERACAKEIGRHLRKRGPLSLAYIARDLAYPVATIEACIQLRAEWFACVGGKWSATGRFLEDVGDLR